MLRSTVQVTVRVGSVVLVNASLKQAANAVRSDAV